MHVLDPWLYRLRSCTNVTSQFEVTAVFSRRAVDT